MTGPFGLFRVELLRLRKRRAVVLLLLAMLLVPLAILTVRILDTAPPTKAEIATARTEAAALNDDPSTARAIADCERKPRAEGIDPASTDVPAACRELYLTQPEDLLVRDRMSLGSESQGSGIAVGVVLTVLSLLVGITFAGHDWGTGSVSNQLLFEPRRWRVWGVKALAVSLVTGLVATVAVLLFWSGVTATVSARGGGLPRFTGVEPFWALARVLLLATAGGLLGFATAMWLRSTVAAIGLVFAGGLIGSLVVLMVSDMAGGRWTPLVNAHAFLIGGDTYQVEVADGCRTTVEDGPVCVQERLVSTADAGLYLLVLLLVIVALSLWSFRRRDVD